MIHGHGGNIYGLARKLGCGTEEIIDMSANVNPLGPPPPLMTFLSERLGAVTALPPVDAAGIVAAFAARHGIAPDRVLAGNGTTQFIYTLPLALKPHRALIVGPTYSDYADACRMHDIRHDFLLFNESTDFVPSLDALRDRAAESDLVFICNPNNPTGALIPGKRLLSVCRALPQTVFVVDESYLPFVADGASHSLLDQAEDNLAVLNSMSKIYRIPGLRIGFMTAGGAVARAMTRHMLPWSVNGLAQAAVQCLMDQPEETDQFIQSSVAFIAEEKRRMIAGLEGVGGLRIFPGHTGFLLMKLPEGRRAGAVCEALAAERILIRNCDNFQGLSDRFIRISLKTGAINRMLIQKLSRILRT